VSMLERTASRTLCPCCMFLELASGKLQSATETGCLFPAAGEAFTSVLAVSLFLPALMVTGGERYPHQLA